MYVNITCLYVHITAFKWHAWFWFFIVPGKWYKYMYTKNYLYPNHSFKTTNQIIATFIIFVDVVTHFLSTLTTIVKDNFSHSQSKRLKITGSLFSLYHRLYYLFKLSWELRRIGTVKRCLMEKDGGSIKLSFKKCVIALTVMLLDWQHRYDAVSLLRCPCTVFVFVAITAFKLPDIHFLRVK